MRGELRGPHDPPRRDGALREGTALRACIAGRREIGAAGENHHRNIEVVIANGTEELQPTHVRHDQIGDDDVEACARNPFLGERRIGFRHDLPTGPGEDSGVGGAAERVVVHEQNSASDLRSTAGGNRILPGRRRPPWGCFLGIERDGGPSVDGAHGRPLRLGQPHRVPLLGRARDRLVQMKRRAASTFQRGRANHRPGDVFRREKDATIADRAADDRSFHE